MDIKARVKKLKTDIPALFYALKEKRTPIIAKILTGIVVVYALSPIDLIPDFIPVLGYLDDLIILPGLIAIIILIIPHEIMDKCRMMAMDAQAGKKTKKWYYGIPIIIIWILVLVIMIKAFFF